MKLETTKGEFVGNAQECQDWLFEMQPSHAAVRVGDFVEVIDTNGTSADDWKTGLRVAVVAITEEAGIEETEADWQQYITVDSLADLIECQHAKRG